MRTNYNDPAKLWADMLQGVALYVDIRTLSEFAAGHPPGALHVPLYEDRAGKRVLQHNFISTLKALRDRTPHTTVLVLACRTGARSKQACALIAAYKLTNIIEFPGGWTGQVDAWGRRTAPGWRDASLPVADDKSTGGPDV
ncbi:MAG: rhodanese-like domain-containing protein [Myxococcales bacterium]|nr:rhodanese-like domain-containing protein [Myxococcales bacterium]